LECENTVIISALNTYPAILLFHIEIPFVTVRVLHEFVQYVCAGKCKNWTGMSDQFRRECDATFNRTVLSSIVSKFNTFAIYF